MPGADNHKYYDLLLGFKLPKKIEWSIENHQRNGNVLVETFLRFKGLESQIIYLWCLENYNHSSNKEILYVTLSRAKSTIIIVGTFEGCNELIHL